MNILITGGTGFIGTKLLERLNNSDNKVFVITRKKIRSSGNINYYSCDLKHFKLDEFMSYFSITSVDVIIYLAANIPTKQMNKETYIDAIRSTSIPFLNFISQVSKEVNRIIYASTIDVVGIPPEMNYSEDVTLNPISAYGYAKLFNEEFLNSVNHKKDKEHLILRFSQVYGPGESKIRLIPIFLDLVLNNNTFKLYGSGNEKRRFLYVDDAVEIIHESITKKTSGTYNIAGSEIISINHLIETTEKLLNKKIKIEKIPASDSFCNVPSIDRAMDELNYRPKFLINDGLSIVINSMLKEMNQ
jgi:UDP-glucose 4-epimerase